MPAQFRFSSFQHRARHLFTPRKPRHPLARVALGLVGVGLLLALVFVSVFLGLAMLSVGLVVRLLRQRRGASRDRRAGKVMDGDYRVVARRALPTA